MKAYIIDQDGINEIDAPSVGFGGVETPHTQVLKSSAGFYIGTLYEEMEGV